MITCSRLTSPHSDAADVFLSQEVPDLHQSSSLLDDDVDGEMGVHRAHFVPEALQSDRTRDAFRQKLNCSTNNGQPDTMITVHAYPIVKLDLISSCTLINKDVISDTTLYWGYFSYYTNCTVILFILREFVL